MASQHDLFMGDSAMLRFIVAPRPPTATVWWRTDTTRREQHRSRPDRRICDAMHSDNSDIQCTHLKLYSDLAVAFAVMDVMRRGREWW
jgi:hypothetical protein